MTAVADARQLLRETGEGGVRGVRSVARLEDAADAGGVLAELADAGVDALLG